MCMLWHTGIWRETTIAKVIYIACSWITDFEKNLFFEIQLTRLDFNYTRMICMKIRGAYKITTKCKFNHFMQIVLCMHSWHYKFFFLWNKTNKGYGVVWYGTCKTCHNLPTVHLLTICWLIYPFFLKIFLSCIFWTNAIPVLYIYKRKVWCSNPSRGRPKSLKQVATAQMPNAWH